MEISFLESYYQYTTLDGSVQVKNPRFDEYDML
jgi:hypothetical protein